MPITSLKEHAFVQEQEEWGSGFRNGSFFKLKCKNAQKKIVIYQWVRWMGMFMCIFKAIYAFFDVLNTKLWAWTLRHMCIVIISYSHKEYVVKCKFRSL